MRGSSRWNQRLRRRTRDRGKVNVVENHTRAPLPSIPPADHFPSFRSTALDLVKEMPTVDIAGSFPPLPSPAVQVLHYVCNEIAGLKCRIRRRVRRERRKQSLPKLDFPRKLARFRIVLDCARRVLTTISIIRLSSSRRLDRNERDVPLRRIFA